MYESKNEALLSTADFARRLAWHVAGAFLLVVIAMLLGVVGHLLFEEISLHDATLNTALVLGGIGPFMLPVTALGKIFIAIYGFITGLFFIASLGVILAPVAHRIMHKFHLDTE
ncbi:two pore domain potassium channel family protein [Paenalcaligenes niemegkensis]|uniref:two pore domain potassium channel family protein n=1 Tax=Paenalcaligenes niemegkensis TaxID=2895469 RepID=UPI001EE9A342|nr:two pore domain potassium channel family protein [Paenalcaligenes niemegkensis]MCQ9618044.1 two pore domain potassium channel family protein [Paenalcaligenes niemegkensis]